jgi:uncharacterized protein (TIGR02444 family)
MREAAADTGATADAFWAFSLDLYARPGVADTCIALQDEHGLDVNLLLLCCWLGWSGKGRLGADGLAATEANAAAWRSAVVDKLRQVRRALGTMTAPGVAALRTEVQRLELAAEREAQRLLVAALPATLSSSQRHTDVEANLTLYLTSRTCDPALADTLLSTLRRMDRGC